MKRLLVFALVVAGVLCVGGARAYFTAQTEIKDNINTEEDEQLNKAIEILNSEI